MSISIRSLVTRSSLSHQSHLQLEHPDACHYELSVSRQVQQAFHEKQQKMRFPFSVSTSSLIALVSAGRPQDPLVSISDEQISFKTTFLPTFEYQYETSLYFYPESQNCVIIHELDLIQGHLNVTESNPVKTLMKPSLSHVEPSSHDHNTANETEAEQYVQVIGLTKEHVQVRVHELCRGETRRSDDTDQMILNDDQMEIVKMIDNGPSENRIDVVFMGDGYTVAEKDKFFTDISRLVKDMWSDTTFASTLPLFNIWAVFVPSDESGIGVGGKPKDTAFGLYRDGTELRGIYCSKRFFAKQVCKKVGKLACDYPSLIANDDYYGGLGGEFVISTRSKTSGTIVLRHEMGHNFVSVGEEYDGGYVYSGCNAAKSLQNLPWSHWVSNVSVLREEPSQLLVQRYAWYDLGKGDYRIQFMSSGLYESWLLQLSVSGMDTSKDMDVMLDGQILPWNASGNLDRFFLDWRGSSGLSNGTHELIIRQSIPPKKDAPIRQLCSVVLHEYGKGYQFDSSIIGAYPTISLYGAKSYRPTNEGCLMRNMTHNRFCKVCQEGLWENLLSQMSLIDGFDVECQSRHQNRKSLGSTSIFGLLDKLTTSLNPPGEDSSRVLLALRLVPLGSLRRNMTMDVIERYSINWYINNVLSPEFEDKMAIPLDNVVVGAKVTAVVTLVSSEVKKPDADFMKSSKSFVYQKNICA